MLSEVDHVAAFIVLSAIHHVHSAALFEKLYVDFHEIFGFALRQGTIV